MSLITTCVVCDRLIHGYNGDCVCERCQQPCPTCGGDVAYCQHPLPERAQLDPKELPDGRFQVAA